MQGKRKHSDALNMVRHSTAVLRRVVRALLFSRRLRSHHTLASSLSKAVELLPLVLRDAARACLGDESWTHPSQTTPQRLQLSFDVASMLYRLYRVFKLALASFVRTVAKRSLPRGQDRHRNVDAFPPGVVSSYAAVINVGRALRAGRKTRCASRVSYCGVRQR